MLNFQISGTSLQVLEFVIYVFFSDFIGICHRILSECKDVPILGVCLGHQVFLSLFEYLHTIFLYFGLAIARKFSVTYQVT